MYIKKLIIYIKKIFFLYLCHLLHLGTHLLHLRTHFVHLGTHNLHLGNICIISFYIYLFIYFSSQIIMFDSMVWPRPPFFLSCFTFSIIASNSYFIVWIPCTHPTLFYRVFTNSRILLIWWYLQAVLRICWIHNVCLNFLHL